MIMSILMYTNHEIIPHLGNQSSAPEDILHGFANLRLYLGDI